MQVCKNLNVSEYLTFKKIPLFLKMHINGCLDCQNAILEYSQKEPISDSVFGKPFEKQKLLWFGPEFANLDLSEKKKVGKSFKIQEAGDLIQELHSSEAKNLFQQVLFFCYKNRKWILAIGYVSILIPLLQIAFQLF
ncbi:hypothetical protein AB3N59_02930 [Leptospira sp. WS92.C1]